MLSSTKTRSQDIKTAVTVTCVSSILWPLGSSQASCFLSVMSLLCFWQALTWRHQKNTVQPVVLSCLRFEEASEVHVPVPLWSAQLSEALRTYHRLRTFAFFFLHPSYFSIAVAVRLERLGVVFSIPRQLERVTGCLAIGPAGETQMVQFSCHPVCLAEMSRSKWRRIYSHTHTHRTHCAYTSTYRSTHRQDPVHAQSRMYVCKALTHTHFFHLHWRLSPDTLVQRHLNRVQQQNEPQFKSLKWGMWNVLPHYPDHQRNNTQRTQGSLK